MCVAHNRWTEFGLSPPSKGQPSSIVHCGGGGGAGSRRIEYCNN